MLLGGGIAAGKPRASGSALATYAWPKNAQGDPIPNAAEPVPVALAVCADDDSLRGPPASPRLSQALVPLIEF